MRSMSSGVTNEQGLARERTTKVAEAVQARLGLVTQDLTTRMAADIDGLDVDDALVELLHASVESNLTTVLHVLEHGIDVQRTPAPAAALEYARRLAQRGVPVNALVRAYRLGQESGLQWLLSELRSQEEDAHVVSAAALHIVSVTSGYVDRITEHVVTAYAEERDVWQRNRSATRVARVQELLAGRQLDVDGTERLLGYRLRLHHLGAVLWTENSSADNNQMACLERAATELAGFLECRSRPLFVPRDEVSAWAWLPVSSPEKVDSAAINQQVKSWQRPIRVALGASATGVSGFRHTHRQASQTELVMLANKTRTPSAVCFDDVGPVALMCADLDATRSWVRDTLGALAVNDEPHARLRQTLYEFLATGCSYLGAAGRLNMHKNSVQYRLRKAEEELGRSSRDDRLNLELAVTVCYWLGDAVLIPAEGIEREQQ